MLNVSIYYFTLDFFSGLQWSVWLYKAEQTKKILKNSRTGFLMKFLICLIKKKKCSRSFLVARSLAKIGKMKGGDRRISSKKEEKWTKWRKEGNV